MLGSGSPGLDLGNHVSDQHLCLRISFSYVRYNLPQITSIVAADNLIPRNFLITVLVAIMCVAVWLSLTY